MYITITTCIFYTLILYTYTLILQDSSLISTTRSRRNTLRNMYNTTIKPLIDKHPHILIPIHYTYDKFMFAWHSIMSRAFGRRLPFSALVPFADCLNHANIATKYDYNIDNNGVFRLFPTAGNRYAAGMHTHILYMYIY